LQYNLEAVAIDPEFAMGYVGLGASYLGLYGRFSNDPRDREAAKVAFDRALELNPQSAVAVGNRAMVAAQDGEWTKVVELVEQVDPWTGVTDVGLAFFSYLVALMNLGRWDDAEAALDELITLVRRVPDRFPPDRLIHIELAWGLRLLRRDYDGAIEQLQPPIGVDAPLLRLANPVLVAAYRATGREPEAMEVFLRRLNPEDRAAARRGYAENDWMAMLRVVIESRQQRGEMCDRDTVEMYAELGDADQLYECLQTRKLGITELLWMLPEYDRYRNDPQFQALLDRRNVVGYKNCCPFSVEPFANP
jgi:tetratricopeptide (TPR) repeat protein